MITGIGSFPFTDLDEAIDLIFETCSEVPFWPQLPKRANYENMYLPFLDGIPCIVADESTGDVYMDTTATEGIEEFYEKVADGRVDAFSLNERLIPGFFRLLDRLGEIEHQVKFIKTQLTGPFSMGLGLKDLDGKAIAYNESYFDIVKKALHMKAQWMVSRIRSRFPGKEIIIFFDEPYLVSFGSAYVSISREEAISLINDVLSGVDAIRGIHCCGNTDWSVLFNADVDIVNYDAFNYLHTIFYFEEDLKRFIAKGGQVSPGIVPSSENVAVISASTVTDLLQRFNEGMEKITGTAERKDYLITTSCGLGSLRPNEARRAMTLLQQLA
jgi:hypothetical protein